MASGDFKKESWDQDMVDHLIKLMFLMHRLKKMALIRISRISMTISSKRARCKMIKKFSKWKIEWLPATSQESEMQVHFTRINKHKDLVWMEQRVSPLPKREESKLLLNNNQPQKFWKANSRPIEMSKECKIVAFHHYCKPIKCKLSKMSKDYPVSQQLKWKNKRHIFAP